jgi:hypothetical protein
MLEEQCQPHLPLNFSGEGKTFIDQINAINRRYGGRSLLIINCRTDAAVVVLIIRM